MEWLEWLLNHKLLNGKKRMIGGIALWLHATISSFPPELGVSMDWADKALPILFWVGTVMLPTGLAHAGVKHVQAKNAGKLGG